MLPPGESRYADRTDRRRIITLCFPLDTANVEMIVDVATFEKIKSVVRILRENMIL